MTTARDVITSALLALEVLGAAETAEAEDADLALTRLNRMLAGWELEGIHMGAPTYAIGDTVNLPASQLEAVEMNLAVRLAPHFAKQPSPIVIGLAKAGYENLLAAYENVPNAEFDDALQRMPSNRHAPGAFE